MTTEHKYEIVRDKGFFSNEPKWVFCPHCGDIKMPPKPSERA